MTRKRRSKKAKIESNEKISKPILQNITKIKKKKEYWIAIALVGIFCLVLLFNAYFNHTSGIAINPEGTTLGTKYFYAGPDPYYNMRLCEVTMETGQYPFVEISDGDPLLNYPVGVFAGARPPLFNMITVQCANFLSNFMPQMDALGMAMLWLPAIYGALLVFPIYGIGKELFNKKVGILAALFVPLIPAHLGAGHGSAYSLFDHDSFLLLLFTITFFFVIKSLKEKNIKQSILYASMGGICIGAIQLTWAVAHTLFIMITLYVIVQFFFDIFKDPKKLSLKVPLSITALFFTGLVISTPYILATAQPDMNIIMVFLRQYLTIAFLISLGITFLYLILKKLNLPWIISLPSLCILGAGGVGFLWWVSLNRAWFPIGVVIDISNVLFGEGVYGGQTALTIGEAHTYGISQTVMSFGPALYWIGLCGFVLFLYHTYKDKIKPYNLFFAIIFLIQFWLTTTAGRFINDMVPAICVFSGYVIWRMLVKIDYKLMFRNIKSMGGFRGVKKGIKLSHIFGILFIGFLVILPNTFLALDAGVPYSEKEKIFGEGYTGAYGLELGQQYYWADACYWLSQQDTNIPNDGDKPGVLTWWDYGFYLVAMSKHPTVADNYQEGLRCAGNFHTAQSEEEGTAVLIIRLVEGVKTPKKQMIGKVPQDVKDTFESYLGNKTQALIDVLENPFEAPSYNQLISPEYGNTVLREDEYNAMYHDATDILMTLSDKELTKLYHEIIDITGYQIRYYGIESRDMYVIYGVFPFLSDKGTHGYATLEDDWFKTLWVDKNTGVSYTNDELNNKTQQEVENMDLAQTTQRKDNYFNSIAYKTFFGIREGTGDTLPNNRVPCYLMKHWKAEYISPQISLAKYYEGAEIKGTVMLEDIGYDGSYVYIMDENGIPHDYVEVKQGQFEVIAPAGNITLSLFIENQKLDEVNIGEVTQGQAMWEEESNFTANFNVEKANVIVDVQGLNSTATLNITSGIYPASIKSEEVFNGNYTFEDLIPSTHEFKLVNETGAVLYSTNKYLKPGNNEISIGE